ncbi:MAG TPA: hypothetical protein VGF79_08740 [Bacteroidia bacterium]
MQLSVGQTEARIGNSLRFLDVYIVLDRVIKKQRTDSIKAEYGSFSKYFESLFERYEVESFAVKLFAPNGTTPKQVDSFTVTNAQETIKESEQTTQNSPPNTEKTTIQRTAMDNTPNSFYALQNELIRNAYETLKKDYDILQQRYNKADDELRIVKTNLAIADGMKEMAVLKGTVEASSSLGGVLKDALKPENADGIAKLVMAVKGIKPESNSQPTMFNGLTQVQKDSVLAITDVIKVQSPEETEAMLAVAIMASKDPRSNYFIQVRQSMESSLSI